MCPVEGNMDSGFVDDEWLDLWASDHQISHSNSFYSMPPIDEDYEWTMSSVPQLMARLSRGGSALTLPPIGEEMSIDVRRYLTSYCMCDGDE